MYMYRKHEHIIHTYIYTGSIPVQGKRGTKTDHSG